MGKGWESHTSEVRVRGPGVVPGLARPCWCCTKAMPAMALTTAAPMSCSRMSSHCMVALEANWHLWFSSRSLWFSSSNLGEARRKTRPSHCCTDPPRLLPHRIPPLQSSSTHPRASRQGTNVFLHRGLLCLPIPFFFLLSPTALTPLAFSGILKTPSPACLSSQRSLFSPLPRLWLRHRVHTPVSGPSSPEHGEASQGVGKVGVEWRQGEATQAPQLP